MIKLSCAITKDILPLYADDAVCAETREAVEEHIAGCGRCREELEKIRTEICPLPSGDSAAVMKKFKKKWNIRQLMKGAGIALAVTTAVIGSLAYIYIYGLPVSSQYAELRSGFQCVYQISQGDDGEEYKEKNDERQSWILDIYYSSGDIRDNVEFEYAEDTLNGERVPTAMTVYMRRTPFVMPWDNSAGQLRMGFAWPEELEITEESNYTVNIVFSDKTVTYSMRDEGLFEIREHSAEFCSCGVK